MPPDVVTGFVVVVVGAVVVVVVVPAVVVVTDVALAVPWPDEDAGSVVLVVVGLDDLEVFAVLPEECPAVVRDGVCSLRISELLPPGCSMATTRPMATVAPVAPRTAPRVSRRSRTRAKVLASRRPFGLVPMQIAPRTRGRVLGHHERLCPDVAVAECLLKSRVLEAALRGGPSSSGDPFHTPTTRRTVAALLTT